MLSNKLQLDYKPVQLILPLNYEHIIDKNDPVVSFTEVVGGLNLTKFIKTSDVGRHDYDSEMMLHVILFGFMENIRSLRKLEKACRTDIRFMYICKGKTPSFMAFQRFIDQKLNQSIEDIFYEINEFLIQKESINTDVIYIDGTKIEANAQKFSFVWKKAVLNHRDKHCLKISKLYQTIEKEFNISLNSRETYLPQDLDCTINMFGLYCHHYSIQFVSGKGKRKTTFQRHYETLCAYKIKLLEYEEHLRICGDRNSYSKTDHDATFMHGKEDYYSKTGIFKPYYNLQIGVSDEYILHLGVYPNPTDTKTFIPFLEGYYDRYQMYPRYPVADAGYGSYDNYLYCLDHGMKLFMKYGQFNKENEKKFKRQTYNIKNMKITPERITASDGTTFKYSHDYIQRRGIYPQYKKVYKHENWDESMETKKIPKTISYDPVMIQLQDQARKNLKRPNGNELRTQRSIQVEGAFGDIKANAEYVRIQRRGNRSVQTELILVAIGFNLRKYHAKKFRKMN